MVAVARWGGGGPGGTGRPSDGRSMRVTLRGRQVRLPPRASGSDDDEHRSQRETAARPRGRLLRSSRPAERRATAPVSDRYDVALFRAPAERRSCSLLSRKRVRPLLVHHEIRRHHGGGHEPCRVLSEYSLGGITIGGGAANVDPLPMFIAMDPPRHDIQRKAVTPVVSPANLEILGPVIRERAGKILDLLPIGEPFDWVDKVSIELTTDACDPVRFSVRGATQLTPSDVVTAIPGHGIVDTFEQKMNELLGSRPASRGCGTKRSMRRSRRAISFRCSRTTRRRAR